jgi:predicted transposase/invertase (TIGR01784 family)
MDGVSITVYNLAQQFYNASEEVSVITPSCPGLRSADYPKERFIFLQLPVFKKDADECRDDFERWIYVLKNMEILDRMPWAAKDSVFRKLAEIGEVSNMTKDERIEYDAALRHYRDTLNVMRGAQDKGRQQGLAEGRLQANIQTAKNLLSMGLNADQIAKATGLSREEIIKMQ